MTDVIIKVVTYIIIISIARWVLKKLKSKSNKEIVLTSSNKVIRRSKKAGFYFKLSLLPILVFIIMFIGQGMSGTPSGRALIGMILTYVIFFLIFVYFIAMGLDAKNWSIRIENDHMACTNMFGKKRIHKYTDISRYLCDSDGIVHIFDAQKKIVSVEVLLEGYDELQKKLKEYKIPLVEGKVNEDNHVVHFPIAAIVFFYAGVVLFAWIFWLTFKQDAFFTVTTYIALVIVLGILYMAIYYTLDRTQISNDTIMQTRLFKAPKVMKINEITHMQYGKSKLGASVLVLYVGKEKVLEVPSQYVNSNLLVRKLEKSHVKWRK
ncbi:MAG: hypothetical protein IJ958_09560 [Agathobacter sp.]|nr:hypothetical protein [Agathobacter sp.]